MCHTIGSGSKPAYRNQASGARDNSLDLDTVLDGQYRVRRFAHFDKPLVLWHLVLYGLSTGPRDKGLSTVPLGC